MSDKAWQLGREERDETVRRVAENLFSLGYSRKKPVSDKYATEVAQQIEETAYNTARIQSETTTGQRPADESLKAYARHDPIIGVFSHLATFNQSSKAYKSSSENTEAQDCLLQVHRTSEWQASEMSPPCIFAPCHLQCLV